MKTSEDKRILTPFESIIDLLIFSKINDNNTYSDEVLSSVDIMLRELNESDESKNFFLSQITSAFAAYLDYINSNIYGNILAINKFDDAKKIEIFQKIKIINYKINSYINNSTEKAKLFVDSFDNTLKSQYTTFFIDFFNFVYKSFGKLKIEGLEGFNEILLVNPRKKGFIRESIFPEVFKYFDERYLFSVCFNHSLKIFNLYLLSVLKAEYLFNDNLSVTGIDRLTKAINKRIRYEADLPREELLIIRDINLNEYLSRILRMNSLYYIFNRKIDKIIDQDDMSIIHSLNEEDSYTNLSNYNTWFDNYYAHSFHPVTLAGVSRIFPVIFGYLLDMTYIDHNFAVAEKELNKLLLLRSTLIKITDIFSKLVLNSSNLADLNSQIQYYSVFQQTIKELLITFNLILIKDNYLIYKIVGSDKSSKLKKYTFLNNDGILTFKEDFILDKYHANVEFLNKDVLVSCFCPGNKNDLLKEWSLNVKPLANFTPINNDISIKLYEEMYLYIIRFNNNKPTINSLDHYIGLFDKQITLESKRFSSDYNDITKYNLKRYNSMINQFIKFSDYIKRLSLKFNDDDFFKYVSELNNMLLPKTNVYSCTFIIRHIEWALEKLKTISQKQESDLEIEVNDLLSLINRLFQLYKELLESIDKGCYCTNFASFYQDSFYRMQYDMDSRGDETKNLLIYQPHQTTYIEGKTTLQRIKRMELSDDIDIRSQIFATESGSVVIFIASTWFSPIGKNYLKDKYEELIRLKSEMELQTQKHERESRQKSKKDFESFVAKLKADTENNNRKTIQILGILAAFMALATMFVDALAKFQNPLQFFQVIGGVTFCLSIFVILLHYIDLSNENKDIIRKKMLLPILLILFILVIFAGSLLNWMGFNLDSNENKILEKIKIEQFEKTRHVNS